MSVLYGNPFAVFHVLRLVADYKSGRPRSKISDKTFKKRGNELFCDSVALSRPRTARPRAPLADCCTHAHPQSAGISEFNSAKLMAAHKSAT